MKSVAKDILKQLFDWGFQYVVEHRDEIFCLVKSFWNGKKIAVIGPTACGKDSLIARLQGNPIPTQHMNTSNPEKIEEYDVRYRINQNNYISFTAKKSINVGGEEPDREKYWTDACKDANIIFYMLDASKFTLSESNEAAVNRFKNDLRWLDRLKHTFKKNVKIVVILNKIDLAIQDNEINLDKNMLNQIIKNELTDYSDFMCGIFPLSLTNDKLFHQFFPTILSTVAKK